MQSTAERQPARLGILFPGDGSDSDQEYHEFAALSPAPLELRVVYTEAEHTLDEAALQAFGSLDRLEAGAREMAPWRPGATIWACTSGSFTVGVDGADRQVTAMERITGAPAGSTSLAFAAASRALGLRRVAVLAPYPEAVTDRFVAFLSDFGVEVTACRSLDLPSGEECSAIPVEEMAGWAEPMDLSRAEALFLSCTSLRTMAGLQQLEHLIGMPVLTSNQVTMWQGMQLLGLPSIHPWLGSLHSTTAAVPAGRSSLT